MPDRVAFVHEHNSVWFGLSRGNLLFGVQAVLAAYTLTFHVNLIKGTGNL